MVKRAPRQEVNQAWRSPAVAVAVLSAAVSLVSLSVAARGCQISQRALEFSAKDFAGARSLVYRATLSPANDDLRLSPADPSLQVQKAEVFIPPQIEKGSRWITPPDFSVSLVVLRYELENVLEQRVSREKGYIKVIDQASVPIIIDSLYTARGGALREKALYELMYIAVISDEPWKRPAVTFKGLAFVQRAPIGQDSSDALKSLWDTWLASPQTRR